MRNHTPPQHNIRARSPPHARANARSFFAKRSARVTLKKSTGEEETLDGDAGSGRGVRSAGGSGPGFGGPAPSSNWETMLRASSSSAEVSGGAGA